MSWPLYTNQTFYLVNYETKRWIEQPLKTTGAITTTDVASRAALIRFTSVRGSFDITCGDLHMHVPVTKNPAPSWVKTPPNPIREWSSSTRRFYYGQRMTIRNYMDGKFLYGRTELSASLSDMPHDWYLVPTLPIFYCAVPRTRTIEITEGIQNLSVDILDEEVRDKSLFLNRRKCELVCLTTRFKCSGPPYHRCDPDATPTPIGETYENYDSCLLACGGLPTTEAITGTAGHSAHADTSMRNVTIYAGCLVIVMCVSFIALNTARINTKRPWPRR